MRDYIKAYNMFLPGRYMKYIIYLILPTVFISIGWISGRAGLMALPLAGMIIFWTEFALDGFVFSGIAKKKNKSLEYIKTSARWKELLKKGLIFDSIRRFIFIGYVIVITEFFVYMENRPTLVCITNGPILDIIFSTMYICLICTICCGIIRHTVKTYIKLLIVYAGCIPFLGGMLMVADYLYNVPGAVVLAVLLIAVVWFQVWHIGKRIEGSFYDE